LVGIPSRLALAALDSGWLWRQEIIWVKSNPLPESVKDRCQRAHETVLHFTRDKKYHAEPGGDLGSHDVWIIPVSRRRFPDGMKHPAVFPEAIPERIIRGYCPLGGVVFDPFVGSGTTVRVANRLGRHGIGADLNIEYLRGAQSA
jgi:DNA modification methylase